MNIYIYIVYINVLYYIFIVKSFQITSSIQSLCEDVSPFHDTSDIVFSMFWWLQLACPTMKWLWNFCKEWDNFGISCISTNAGFRPSAVVISSLDMILIVVAFKCEWMALHKYFPVGHMIDIKRLWNNIYCSFALFHTATISQKETQYQRTLIQQQGTQQQGSDGRFVGTSSHQIPNFNMCSSLMSSVEGSFQLAHGSKMIKVSNFNADFWWNSASDDRLPTSRGKTIRALQQPVRTSSEANLCRQRNQKLSFKCGSCSWMICFLLRPF